MSDDANGVKQQTAKTSQTDPRESIMHDGPYHNGYVELSVSLPQTHHTWEQGRYTTYLIELRTNNRAFNKHQSEVRRRYSDFIWLRAHLQSQFPKLKPPCLPPKKFFGAQFSEEVINQRAKGLEEFLNQVCSEPLFLSDCALHLFLQSSLALQDIVDVITGHSARKAKDIILGINNSTESGKGQDVNEETNVASSGYDASVTPFSLPKDKPSTETLMKKRSISTPALTSLAREQLDTMPALRGILCSSYKSNESGSKMGSLPEDSDVMFPNLYADSDESGHSGGSPGTTSGGIASPSTTPGGTKINVRRKKKSVTFSPQVTVAEVIDRFSRRPSQVHLTDVPSNLFASTMAY